MQRKENTTLRLNQAIAKTGFCSRRAADRYIADGNVSVNGAVAREFSRQVDPKLDEIVVDGHRLKIEKYLYVVMNKPRGIVSTCSDEQGRKGVLDLLPPEFRHLRPVGRLDMYSEGLLLFSNDGALTQSVTHPSHHLPKVYVVTVGGKVQKGDLKRMQDGVRLDKVLTLPAKARLIDSSERSSSFELTIIEGKNRQIRRMCEALGYSVKRLVRVAVGGLQLGEIPPGSWRYLTREEVKSLLTVTIE